MMSSLTVWSIIWALSTKATKTTKAKRTTKKTTNKTKSKEKTKRVQNPNPNKKPKEKPTQLKNPNANNNDLCIESMYLQSNLNLYNFISIIVAVESGQGFVFMR